MQELAGFPYVELVFNKDAAIVDRSGFEELLAELSDGGAADVLVFAHGWNNDIADAKRLYTGLATQLRAVSDASPPAQLGTRRLALVGVFWPSKRFTDEGLIAGGSAGTGPSAVEAQLEARLDELKGAFDADDADDRLARAKALVPVLEDDPAARDEFVELVRGALGDRATSDEDDASADYDTLPGREALERLKAPIVTRRREDSQGGAAGGAATGQRRRESDEGAARGESRTGFGAAAQRYLNLATYYQMKDRAGLIGESGLNPRLRELRERAPAARLHLVGHSFGGRLVTAATVGAPGAPAVEPDSVTLLQAAFSHYGFAEDYEPGKNGFFRRMLSDHMTRGPVLVTHSTRDSAVGSAYPLASRLAGFAASALGDKNDRYGGIGRNGAQKTPEAITGWLGRTGTTYAFKAGHIHNLNADTVILDHSDIRGEQVAYAILSAVASPTPGP